MILEKNNLQTVQAKSELNLNLHRVDSLVMYTQKIAIIFDYIQEP